MFILKWLAQYNKAMVPITMAIIYYLNEKYGIEIPVSEANAMVIWGIIAGFVTWAVPNKKLT